MENVWEGVALSLLRALGAESGGYDARALAQHCGLETVPYDRGDAELVRGRVYYPAKARHVRQQGAIAHELGHWALDWAGEEQSELGASYVGAALLLPRQPFMRSASDAEWDLGSLMERWPHASAQLIAHRLAELAPAVASVFDQGKLRRRIVGPGLKGLAKVTPLEVELADKALAHERVARAATGRTHATPLLDGPHRRVVVVTEPWPT